MCDGMERWEEADKEQGLSNMLTMRNESESWAVWYQDKKKVYRKEKPQWAMTGDSRCQTSPKICVEVWGQTPFAMFTRFGTTEAPLQQCPNTKSFLWWLSTPWRLAKVSPQSNKHAETTLDLLGQHEQHDCLRT